MMKNQFSILALVSLLFGCNPFNERQGKTEQFVKEAADVSRKIYSNYQPKIREISQYKVYRYKDKLSDPFRARGFMIQEAQGDTENVVAKTISQCVAPQCTPPMQHDKTLLEGYSLNSLEFVGTLMNKNYVALIKTPDIGVVEAKVGGYMGKNYGKVLEINKSFIVLQEKLLKGGVWKNKKTVLVIKR